MQWINKKLVKTLPNRPLTDVDLKKFTSNIPHFRGVFMRDSLPKRSRLRECGIINLDSSVGPGTHWVAYYKNGDKKEYFDSFGNLQPPLEIIKYLGKNLMYNYKREQNYDSFNCGHLCIKFLHDMMK